jgi:hypothetical protein
MEAVCTIGHPALRTGRSCFGRASVCGGGQQCQIQLGVSADVCALVAVTLRPKSSSSLCKHNSSTCRGALGTCHLARCCRTPQPWLGCYRPVLSMHQLADHCGCVHSAVVTNTVRVAVCLGAACIGSVVYVSCVSGVMNP